MPKEVLQNKALAVGLQGNTFDDVNEAILAAKNTASETDVILICGSFFIVSEIE